MKKRVISLILLAFILLPLFSFIVSAEELELEEARGSSYLNMYGAGLHNPSVQGKLDLTFRVVATDYMDTVGVMCIFVRNSNGTIHQIIWGTTSNGLLDSNTWYHAGVYRLSLTSGNTYYCNVIVIAGDANGSDTRTVTTQQVVCP